MAFQWLATDFGGPDVLRQVPVEVAPPTRGEVTMEVRAAGMNPADYKHFAAGQDPLLLPLTIGYEASGVLSAIGPGTEIATGGGAVGDAVVAFQVTGAYASHLPPLPNPAPLTVLCSYRQARSPTPQLHSPSGLPAVGLWGCRSDGRREGSSCRASASRAGRALSTTCQGTAAALGANAVVTV